MEPRSNDAPTGVDSAARPLRATVTTLEQNRRLDVPARVLQRLARQLAKGPRGDALRGNWLGHAVHPLLTDLPLGCWLSAGMLDLIGGKASRRAAQRLVGLGLLAVPPTVATGLADYARVEAPGTRRVGAVHALGNSVVATCYLFSWRTRRAGHHWRGVLWGIVGGSLAWYTGYLGGHLSFGRGVGVGERGGLSSAEEGYADRSAGLTSVPL
jgi:uncharacterized membrane protein